MVRKYLPVLFFVLAVLSGIAAFATAPDEVEPYEVYLMLTGLCAKCFIISIASRR